MLIEQNKNIFFLNTFKISVLTDYYTRFSSIEELDEIINISTYKEAKNHLIIGGGSNILFTKNFNGIILHNKIKGINIIEETEELVFVEVGAGEVWHDFVQYCIHKNWYGIENLSLIPGTVGAAPIQNIGGYGVEFKNICNTVTGFDLVEKKMITFSNAQCNFAYRDSIFKSQYKNNFIITKVCFVFSKKKKFNLSYQGIQSALQQQKIENPTLQDISNIIIHLRNSKLPNPAEIGNAGSFFKNPIINLSELNYILNKIPSIQTYPINENLCKISAAALIEYCGWKGYRNNNVGCYEKQALVLVNFGNASGQDVLALATKIQESVLANLGINLETEVRII